MASNTRNCVSCGRTIAWDANVCQFCGHDYRAQMAGPQPAARVGTGIRILVYLLSFFIPLLGFIIGAVFYSNKEPDYKHVGKVCIIIALWPVIVILVCWLLVVLAGITLIAI